MICKNIKWKQIYGLKSQKNKILYVDNRVGLINQINFLN